MYMYIHMYKTRLSHSLRKTKQHNANILKLSFSTENELRLEAITLCILGRCSTELQCIHLGSSAGHVQITHTRVYVEGGER